MMQKDEHTRGEKTHTLPLWAIVEAMKNSQVTSYVQVYIASTLKQKEIEDGCLHFALKCVVPSDCYTFFESFSRGVLQTNNHLSIHSKDARVVYEIVNADNILHGDYLELYIPLKYEGSAQNSAQVRTIEDALKIARSVIAYIRLTFGAASLIDVHLAVERTTDNKSITYISDSARDFECYFFDDQVYKEADEIVKDELAFLNPAPETLLSVLSAAERSSRPTVRFLLLWIGVEVAIGDGQKRKSYCLNELKSPECNELLRKAHILRGDLIHKGVESEDLGRLETALRIIILSSLFSSSKAKEDIGAYLGQRVRHNRIQGPKIFWITQTNTYKFLHPLKTKLEGINWRPPLWVIAKRKG